MTYGKTLSYLLTCFVASLPLVSPLAAEEPPAENWTQWRGPERDGLLPETAWPKTLDESTLRSLWRVEFGPSYSGPIVTKDQVFTTETKDEEVEIVRALDRATGEQLWQTEWAGAMTVPFFAAANGSWIRATPVLDGNLLYVAGMRDVLVCLDARTGVEIWKVDFVEELETPLPSFGCASSPLIHGDHVYIQAAASVVKLEKKTGKVVWRAMKDGGGMSGSAFSSPIVATIAGQPQLVVQGRTTLAGIDLESGEVLWSQEIPAFRGMNIVTPTVVDDTVFTSSYGGSSLLFSVTAADDESLQVEEVWKNRTQGYMSSPIVIDGHVFLHLRNQRFTCIELATGETKWTTTPFGKYWSMVASGSQILALDERGELLLIRANPEEFDLIDRRKISEESTWAYLAVSGDDLFIRELGALQAFRWKDSGEDD